MKKDTFTNPILPGFYPDPSICRVGEDYYLINSSFTFYPGLPIFHSQDLVHWEQLGHVLDRPSQLNLDHAPYTGGIFAPTIRHHDDMFYVITTNVSDRGNFIVTAKDPRGPWSEPYWISDAPGIDPSLFFDDSGKVYFLGTREKQVQHYTGDQEIWLQELDLKTLRLTGEKKTLWDGALKTAYFVEGPHLYKVGDYYYLMIAEGGTEHFHSVTIARSKNILGPYEPHPGNPILTHRHLGKDAEISNTGHADLVQTQFGDWYMVALASRPYGGYYKNLCRETFLIPVIWEDEWPVVSPGTGKIEMTYPVPSLPARPFEKASNRDDFDQAVLKPVWNTLQTPREEYFSLTERPGYLRLKLRPQSMIQKLDIPIWLIRPDERQKESDSMAKGLADTESDQPSFIGRRQQHMNFEAVTAVDFTPESVHETAGLALIQNDNHQYRFELALKNGERIVRLIRHVSHVHLDVAAKTFSYENEETVLSEAITDPGTVILKVAATGQDYSFLFGSAHQPLTPLCEPVDGRILCSEVAGGCSGTYIGMFASSKGTASESFADFDWFDYHKKD